MGEISPASKMDFDGKPLKKYLVCHFPEDNSVVAINYKACFESGQLILGPQASKKVKLFDSKTETWFAGEILGHEGM